MDRLPPARPIATDIRHLTDDLVGRLDAFKLGMAGFVGHVWYPA